METFKFYSKKDAALKNPEKNKSLWSFDVALKSGPKNFFYATDKQIFERKNGYFYEMFEKQQPVKFFLDVDIGNTSDRNYCHRILKSLIDEINEILNNHFNLEISYKDLIILESDGLEERRKGSFHVIYQKLAFKNVYMIKQFSRESIEPLLNENLREYYDSSVYKTGSLRIFLN